jgi:hypothetical protein
MSRYEKPPRDPIEFLCAVGAVSIAAFAGAYALTANSQPIKVPLDARQIALHSDSMAFQLPRQEVEEVDCGYSFNLMNGGSTNTKDVILAGSLATVICGTDGIKWPVQRIH